MEEEEGERHAREMRESRNRLIEAEVEARRIRQERERVENAMAQDEKEQQAKMEEIARVKRQVAQ